jgi:integrase
MTFDNEKTFIDERSYLFKQKNSSKWYARLYVGKVRFPFSTKESDFDKARLNALKYLGALESDISNKLSSKKSAFGVVAQEYIESITTSASATKNEKTYCSALRKYHIPFFGKIKVNKITEDNIEDFNTFREEVFGKPFSKSAILNHNAAMNKVFDRAVRKKLMKKSEIPDLAAFGKRTQSRDHFEVEDLIKIQDYLENTTSKNKIRNEIYKVLYHYMDFIVNTGARPGTEVNNIQWKDLELYAVKSLVRLRVHIRKGKTSDRKGTRTVTPNHGFLYSYIDLLESNPDRNPEDYVFRTKNGKSLEQIGKVFSEVLQNLGIKDGENGPRSLYSLRHTFITERLRYGWNHHMTAKVTGTSIQMIEAHYDGSTAANFADQTHGVKNAKSNEIKYDDAKSYILDNYYYYRILVNEFIKQKKNELGDKFSLDNYSEVLEALKEAKILDDAREAERKEYLKAKNKMQRRKKPLNAALIIKRFAKAPKK